MANLGTITWTSVVWTTGDVITEAKLDNMTANEQAYDSHSSQGLLLDNGKALAAKSSGGTAYDLLRLNTSNVAELTAWDAWIKLPTDNVPSYASATTITNPTGIDWTTYLRKGDKIKLTQTTVKYFYVTGVTSTTLSITGGSDYTLTNAAISEFYYSKGDPLGFPDSFAFTVSITGFSANPNMIGRFTLKGNICTVFYTSTTNGTSNATTYTVSLPITAKTVADFVWRNFALVVDNGTAQDGIIRILSAATTASFLRSAEAAFTGSGNKSGNAQITYEIA